MAKILIVGIVASGKTTLARQMSRRMDIPWYELDSIVHLRKVVDGQTKRTKDEQVEMIMEIDRGDRGFLRGWIGLPISVCIRWLIRSFSLIPLCGSAKFAFLPDI
jgi:adenylate kinase family enzyme